MRKKATLKTYKREIEALKEQGKEWGLSEEEVNFAYGESLLYLKDKFPALYNRNPEDCPTRKRRLLRFIIIFLIIITGICYGLSYHKPTHNFVERNIQEAIYPFMKLYRKITLPLIEWFPSLTGNLKIY